MLKYIFILLINMPQKIYTMELLTIEELTLFRAISENNSKGALSLLAAHADANCKDQCGMSPLMHACKMGNLTIVKALMISQAEVNAHDKNHCTPLMFAIMAKNIAIVNFLIPAGADINTKNTDGETPLSLAIRFNCTEIERVLRENGAKENRCIIS